MQGGCSSGQVSHGASWEHASMWHGHAGVISKLISFSCLSQQGT